MGAVKPLPLCALSPAVCKFKAHKRCAVRSTNNCKWTTLASIGSDIIEDEEGVSGEGREARWATTASAAETVT